MYSLGVTRTSSASCSSPAERNAKAFSTWLRITGVAAVDMLGASRRRIFWKGHAHRPDIRRSVPFFEKAKAAGSQPGIGPVVHGISLKVESEARAGYIHLDAQSGIVPGKDQYLL